MSDPKQQVTSERGSANESELEDWFAQAMRSREQIRRASAGKPLTPAEDIIYEMRERRDAQLLGNYLRSLAERNGEYVDESGIRGDGVGEKPHWQVLLEFA